MFDFLPVSLAANRALHQRNIDTFGKVFAVYQRAVYQVDTVCQRQKLLVYIQK